MYHFSSVCITLLRLLLGNKIFKRALGRTVGREGQQIIHDKIIVKIEEGKFDIYL